MQTHPLDATGILIKVPLADINQVKYSEVDYLPSSGKTHVMGQRGRSVRIPS